MNPDLKNMEKFINNYYDTMDCYKKQNALNESTVETAFKNLLIDIGNTLNLTLIKKSIKTKQGNNITPDGIIKDEFKLTRGHWEAKDSKDSLDLEISKKIKKGYPLKNIIFEDTETIVLYQNDKIKHKRKMSNKDDLLIVLNDFFSYSEPNIDDFYSAVKIFEENIPNLGEALAQKIESVKKKDKEFAEAINDFKNVRAQMVHKEMSEEDVEDMLIQHLLTERIFRKVFNNPDFRNRNNIAKKLEELVSILTHKEFNRNTFFKSIDHFYKAIENTASEIDDFHEKQDFLNEIYEMFFKKYSKKNADKNGIVYTPQPVVKFMVYFTEQLLKKEFNRSFSTKKVNIIDPCVGTGTFILNILDSIRKDKLEYKYENEIFCNELMLLPYYISSVNIEYYFYEKMGRYEPFENIIFTDSLDLIEDEKTRGTVFSTFTDTNADRARKEILKDFFVIIGNPPYNASQEDANENNPNTKNEYIDKLIQETYVEDSKAQLKNKLYDPYVKFFKWAKERLRKKDGVIVFISNNSFIDGAQFDGMRKHLMKDFDRVYHLDLGGNIYKNPKLSGTKHNVFGIKVGVGVTFLFNSKKLRGHKFYYYKTDEYWTKEQKYDFLLDCIEKYDSIEELITKRIRIDKSNNFVFDDSKKLKKYESYIPLYDNSDKSIFEKKYPGISTNRNEWVYDYFDYELTEKMNKTIDFYNSEVGRFEREKINLEENIDIKEFVRNFVKYDNENIKWSEGLLNKLRQLKYASFKEEEIVVSDFRPFIKKFLYYDSVFVDRPSKYSDIVKENNPILLCNGVSSKKASVFVVKNYPNLDLLEKTQTFPLYYYEEGEKKCNISDNAYTLFKDKLGNEKFSKEDIFYYIYGILNHPKYFDTFKEKFKKEPPRIPIYKQNFFKIRDKGKSLMDLHLNYENVDEYDLEMITDPDKVYNTSIQKMKLVNDKTTLIYNDVISLSNIPSEAFIYEINGRSIIEWIIDQYQNIEIDDSSVLSLIKKAVTISLETLKIKNQLEKIKIK